MILQQLYNDADRILGQDMPPPMYKSDAVRWVVPLTLEGHLDGSEWVRMGDAKRGAERQVPYPGPRAGVRLVPSLIVDYPAYVLGIGEEKDRPAQKHAAYRQLVKRCFEATGSERVRAVDRWLDRWDSGDERPFQPPGLTSQDRIAFEVDGDWPTNEREVKAFWATATQNMSDNGPVGECLITGIEGPIEASLPGMLKGIPGGQTAGVAMISANAPAFESFGRERACTSPISRDAAERFTKALNALLSGERTSIRVGGIVYVFWTRSGPDKSVWGFLGGEPDTGEVLRLISSAWTGKREDSLGIGDDDFYALGLTASGARAVVRDWLHTTVPRIHQRLGEWFALQEIVAPDGGPPRYFSIRTFAVSLYRDFKDIATPLPGQMIRAALHGDPLPLALLSHAVQRCRAEQRVTHPRAALIKAVLAMNENIDRQERKEYAKSMSNLDLNHPSPAYHCGRLLAELDVVQRAALGQVNTTLIDRYYGAASTTPGLVFGILLTNASKAHLPKIRKTKPNVYGALQRRIEEIMVPLKGGFPKTLSLQDQALFSLGFYLQRANDRAEAAEASAAKRAGKATPEQLGMADAPIDDQQDNETQTGTEDNE